MRARWDALPRWLRESAQHNTALRAALEPHVVRGEPLAHALVAVRDYLCAGGPYGGLWSDDPDEAVAILRALPRHRPLSTGGPGWGR